MSQAVAAGGKVVKKPSELLAVLDSLCMYRIEDWWTYELCYKKHVRQFHKDDKVWLLCGFTLVYASFRLPLLTVGLRHSLHAAPSLDKLFSYLPNSTVYA